MFLQIIPQAIHAVAEAMPAIFRKSNVPPKIASTTTTVNVKQKELKLLRAVPVIAVKQSAKHLKLNKTESTVCAVDFLYNRSILCVGNGNTETVLDLLDRLVNAHLGCIFVSADIHAPTCKVCCSNVSKKLFTQ